MKVAVGLRRVAAGKRTSGRRAAQIAEIHMELNEEEKRQLFQVDGDCQAKVMNCI